ncbi:MAG: PHP domain-containing protein [Spirochaetales bacterium]|nr:PHP domain-containing protein [Spirochaetales bacterium]
MFARIDLHNHSCLSPCGSNDMTPGMLAFEAMEKGIQILGLSDHNCGRNLPAFKSACETCGIVPVMGIEVNTVEEVHVLGLFGTLEDAMDFSSFIEFLLPDIKNNPQLFGEQLIINDEEEVCGTFEKNLIGTCGISFSDLVEEVLARDGLIIPAHIDRYALSVKASLGFLPDMPYSAVEVITLPPVMDTLGNTVIQGSDAHYLREVGRRSCRVEVPEISFAGLKEGLKNGIVKYGPGNG